MLFNNEKGVCRKRHPFYFISSIWDDDNIQRLEGNNWHFLWYYKTFKGINATMVLSHIPQKKGMNVKKAYIDKSHTTKYQELQHLKASQKGVI